ncbi:MAG TPA: NAD-dependent protein deacetylase [Polyangiaceae bacterium]|nr:NAD-dependent protein deacetylase [Polyangiaceae bacterium]
MVDAAPVDSSSNLGELAGLFAAGGVVVLTGAGVSTDSGIPAYRDEEGRWKQSAPMQFRDFTSSVQARQRYWARSMVGWERMAQAQPNRAHRALAELERSGALSLLITQNVDGLHSAAGSEQVVDLHGRLDRVICLDCAQVSPRAELQARLVASNPEYVGQSYVTRADGDVELAVDYERFVLAACVACGGTLKPDVVFFGENVPAPRFQVAMAALEAARALLIVGSSLMVFSGFRFARAAARLAIPIVIVNRGKTRADELASLRLDGNVGELLDAALRANPVQVDPQPNGALLSPP